MKIRNGRPSDLDAILEIWLSSWRLHEAREPLLFKRGGSRRAWRTFAASQEAFFRKALGRSSRRHRIWVAVERSAVVGFARAETLRLPHLRHPRAGLITDADVRESHRRKGIGAKLVGAAFRWLLRSGIRHVKVGYILKNELSSSFWRKMGFEPYYLMARRKL